MSIVSLQALASGQSTINRNSDSQKSALAKLAQLTSPQTATSQKPDAAISEAITRQVTDNYYRAAESNIARNGSQLQVAQASLNQADIILQKLDQAVAQSGGLRTGEVSKLLNELTVLSGNARFNNQPIFNLQVALANAANSGLDLDNAGSDFIELPSLDAAKLFPDEEITGSQVADVRRDLAVVASQVTELRSGFDRLSALVETARQNGAAANSLLTGADLDSNSGGLVGQLLGSSGSDLQQAQLARLNPSVLNLLG